MATAKERERAEEIENLRTFIQPGDTVYCNLLHVSRSGMLRVIRPYIIRDNTPRWIGWQAAIAIEASYDRDRDGVKMHGCGMDMGFSLVYNLAAVLFRDGFGCIGENCPSNDHSNGDRNRIPHDKMKRRRTCPTCEGSGEVQLHRRSEEVTACRTCSGKGKIGPGHWHRDGGYALRHVWM